ncbi:hypothetical protein D3C81_2054460 [compost metagenome]
MARLMALTVVPLPAVGAVTRITRQAWSSTVAARFTSLGLKTFLFCPSSSVVSSERSMFMGDSLASQWPWTERIRQRPGRAALRWGFAAG